MQVGVAIECMAKVDVQFVRDAARIEQTGNVVTAKLHDMKSKQIGQETAQHGPLNVRQQAPRRFAIPGA
jgi:hypothetical protein